MAAVVRIDPRNRTHAILIPMVVDRIEAMATDGGDPDGRKVADRVASRLYMGDPSVCVIGIIDEESATLVGHVLAAAMWEEPGAKPVVQVTQYRADKNVGDALITAVEQALMWGRSLDPKLLTVTSKRDGKELAQRLGLKHYRYILRMPLTDDPDSGRGPSISPRTGE